MVDIRPRGFQSIPPVIKNLLIINLLVWIAEMTFRDSFISILSLHYYQHPDFGIWQVVTYMFLHASWGHILFNMLALWMFGSVLEEIWRSKRFLIFYLICGIGAAIFVLGSKAIAFNILDYKYATATEASRQGMVMQAAEIYNSITLGASGAINGVMAAFAWLFPNMPIMIFPLPFQIKIKYLVILYFLVDLFGGIAPRGDDNIAHFAHVGGAIIGLILVITMNKSNRRTFY